MMILAFILGVWLLAGLCAMGLRIVQALPAVAAVIVCLPVWPFVVARRNRHEHPIQAKMLYWLWGTFCLLAGFAIVMDAIH